jgi:tetratricopeptide (TPR) repeat protein
MSEVRRPMGLFDEDEDEEFLFLEEDDEEDILEPPEEKPKRGLGQFLASIFKRKPKEETQEQETETPTEPPSLQDELLLELEEEEDELDLSDEFELSPLDFSEAELEEDAELEEEAMMTRLGEQGFEEILLESMQETASEAEETEEKQGFLAQILARFRKKEPPLAEERSAEEEEAPSRKRRARGIGGFTRGQVAVLGVLGILVVVVYGVLISTVVRTTRSLRADAGRPSVSGTLTDEDVTVVMLGQGTPQPTTEAPAGPTKSPTEMPTPTTMPTATPTPIPAISTQFDYDISQDPDNVELRLQRGEEYLDSEAYGLALMDFEHAQSVDPERAEIYLGMGKAYFHLRRWKDAEAALGTAISFNHDMRDAHFWLGTLYYYQGHYEEAAKEFDWAAEIDPTYAEAETWLAIASYHAENPQEAMDAAERALAMDEHLPLAYVARAWAWVIQDEISQTQAIEKAQGDMIYAQGLAPYDFEVSNQLARFYIQYRPERLSEAEQLAYSALNWAESDLQKALALQTLGRIYLAQGRKEDARNTFNQASDLATADGKLALAGLAKDLEKTFEP